MHARLLIGAGAAAAICLAVPASATTLDEAIAAALSQAPDVVAARAQLDAAGGRVTQARSAGFPVATVTGTIGTGHLDPDGFFGLGASDVTPRAAQGTIEQPLFTGGRVGSAIRRAKAGRSAAEAGFRFVRGQVVTDTAAAYGAVLVGQRQVELSRRLVEELAEIERQARLRFKAGESPSTDVSQAVARSAEARAGLAQAEGDLVSARARYRNLVGVEADALAPLPAPPETPSSLDQAIEAALANNPSVAQAEAGLAAARSAVSAARAEWLPSVGAFAEASAVRDQFFPDYRADSTTVGVRARWQFSAGGRVSGLVNEAKGEQRAAEARLRGARAEVEAGVATAFQGVRTARLVADAAQDRSRAADAALTSVRHEVRVGMKPQIDLLDAEREAMAAATAASQAQAGAVVAAYRLNALLGRY